MNRNSPLEPLRDLSHVEIYNGVPGFAQARRRRVGAKGAGLRYEEKVQDILGGAFARQGLAYLPSPWFKYRRRSAPDRENFAQPDGIAPDVKRGIIFLVEIKIKHTPDSYFQLLDRYVPLLDAFFNSTERLWRIAPIEVCRWYDPLTAYPCKVKMIDQLHLAEPKDLSVHVCRTD